ncbi:hypothetical protein [Actinomadura violacea]|uniref:Uncharacterized protein n=1 Tax=Actinomadura violacea TaxID=2819934 RepID=A0ABS3RKL8_9ACTN|nr:hypothetical protein [Actinomadura violacea]MBO2457274.1 hypothetical protein [Actinomadura violacea]
MRQAAWTHHQVHQRVHGVMTAAMRADAHAIEAALGREDRLDPYSRRFAVEARRLVLACTAALTCVMATHRPGDDSRGREICRGCGTPDCRTLQGVSDVLAAYAVRPVAVDRAEAWRRADAHFAAGGRPVPLVVEEFPEGFLVRRALDGGDDVSPVLVVDRETGALSRWPSMPFDILVREYGHYRKGK